ncbi:hypothetical protein FB451DRAFT_1559941 [Mycena latifolia]|nr:hypothetical protein FB451DRAFT_1559941 [Mycena latifolia]
MPQHSQGLMTQSSLASLPTDPTSSLEAPNVASPSLKRRKSPGRKASSLKSQASSLKSFNPSLKLPAFTPSRPLPPLHVPVTSLTASRQLACTVRVARSLTVIFPSSAADPSASSDADDGGDGCDDDELALRFTASHYASSRTWSGGALPSTLRLLSACCSCLCPVDAEDEYIYRASAPRPIRPSFPFCFVRFNAGLADARARERTGAAHESPPAVLTMTPARTSLYAESRYSSPSDSRSSSRRRPDTTYAHGERAKQASSASASEWLSESASESDSADSPMRGENAPAWRPRSKRPSRRQLRHLFISSSAPSPSHSFMLARTYIHDTRPLAHPSPRPPTRLSTRPHTLKCLTR